MDTIENVGYFRQSTKKWHIPVHSIVYLEFRTLQITFFLFNTTRKSWIKAAILVTSPGGHFSIKKPSYQYRDSSCKGKMVSYRIIYTMVILYPIRGFLHWKVTQKSEENFFFANYQMWSPPLCRCSWVFLHVTPSNLYFISTNILHIVIW